MRSLLPWLALMVACGSDPDPALDRSPIGPMIQLPSRFLDFGSIAAEEARTERIEITSTGDAPLVIYQVELLPRTGDGWRAEPLVDLRLEPGAEAELTVTYQACPALWSGRQRRASADPCACLSRADSAVLVLDTNAGEERIELLATVLPPSPRISIAPESVVDFGRAEHAATVLTATVTIGNTGCRHLTIHGIDLVEAGGGEQDSFTSPRCPAWPCLSNATLCSSRSPGCGEPGLVLPLRYENRGAGGEQIAELRIESDDPLSPERVMLLFARSPGCSPPLPAIQIHTDPPCIGEPVSMSASLLDAGTSTIVRWQWLVLFSQGRAPTLTTTGTTAELVPSDPGLHVVSVVAESGCGADHRAIATFTVSERCR